MFAVRQKFELRTNCFLCCFLSPRARALAVDSFQCVCVFLSFVAFAQRQCPKLHQLLSSLRATLAHNKCCCRCCTNSRYLICEIRRLSTFWIMTFIFSISFFCAVLLSPSPSSLSVCTRKQAQVFRNIPLSITKVFRVLDSVQNFERNNHLASSGSHTISILLWTQW